MNWISVKEIAPSKTGEYIVWDGIYVTCSFYTADVKSKFYGFDCEFVTHWMPLPNPPTIAREEGE